VFGKQNGREEVSAMKKLLLIFVAFAVITAGRILAQLWMLRTQGIPGPIDIGYGIP